MASMCKDFVNVSAKLSWADLNLVLWLSFLGMAIANFKALHTVPDYDPHFHPDTGDSDDDTPPGCKTLSNQLGAMSVGFGIGMALHAMSVLVCFAYEPMQSAISLLKRADPTSFPNPFALTGGLGSLLAIYGALYPAFLNMSKECADAVGFNKVDESGIRNVGLCMLVASVAVPMFLATCVTLPSYAGDLFSRCSQGLSSFWTRAPEQRSLLHNATDSSTQTTDLFNETSIGAMPPDGGIRYTVN